MCNRDVKTDIEKIFNFYASGSVIFARKDFLQSSYLPDVLPHRENHIKHLAQILAPSLRLENPSNVFLYGRPGTGKTAVVQYVGSQLQKIAQDKNIPVKFLYVNSGLKKIADTEYRLYAYLCRRMGDFIPDTGIPTSSVFDRMIKALDSKPAVYILALDEIDVLIEKSPNTIYTLSRINSELKNSKLSIIGITNDLSIMSHLDAKTKSSLSEEEIIFSPYNANQIKDILQDRSNISFSPGAINDSVILLCAASAAKNHGDVRRAIELLRISAEIAEREASNKVLRKHVEVAIGKFNTDQIISFVKTLPEHQKNVLKAIIELDKPVVYTREIYNKYIENVSKIGAKGLTMRRVLDILGEFESSGVVGTSVISRGRYGRTKVVELKIGGNIKDDIEQLLVEI